jgi:hypothetical protein
MYWRRAQLVPLALVLLWPQAVPAQDDGLQLAHAYEQQAAGDTQTSAAEDWAVHGQTTFVAQYHPRFPALFSGPNSLTPKNQARETYDLTLYAGVRPWSGAELWVNPELDQGFGLSTTLGVAGFTSGEAYKVGHADVYPRIPRVFFRQTINLGGENQALDAGANQLAGGQTADRIVLTIGKFAVPDIFDTNRYAHDPRSDFFNWSVIEAGSFDYAADAWGYTYGAAAEWYQDWWTIRSGLFNLSKTPNSKAVDTRVFDQYQLDEEVEERHELRGQPGKLKLLGFLSHGRMGAYSRATEIALETGSPADIAAVRKSHNRPGVRSPKRSGPSLVPAGRRADTRLSTSPISIRPYPLARPSAAGCGTGLMTPLVSRWPATMPRTPPGASSPRVASAFSSVMASCSARAPS